MSKILAMYDVMQIQDFVFSSSKLKENVGASGIVQKILDEFLKDSITNCCSNTITEWEPGTDLRIKESDLDAEVVYNGGGNAMVAYKNETAFKKANEHLSAKILEETGGEIKFAVACVNTDFSRCKEDRKALVQKLQKYKYKMVQTSPLLGTAITREGQTDGLPAQDFEKFGENEELKEYLSFPAKQKRDFGDKVYFEELLERPSEYSFPKEFDDLGQREGESHIAVVHIDGNDMGKRLDEVKDYAEMRTLSMEITNKYNAAMAAVIKKTIESFKDKDFFKSLNVKFEKNKNGYLIPFVPVRAIVLNGDDVTFVTDGRIGIPLAEAFLKQISRAVIEPSKGKKIQLSACAGVAIVKSHFPFYRAYQLAEELCLSAKLKGKILARQSKMGEVGNWLDFHIVYSGVTTDLKQIRKNYYNVPAMDEVEELKYPPYDDNPEMKFNRYNLLWRPWCVTGEFEEKYSWKSLKQILNYFRNNPKWSRSKLKKLRNESIKSEADIDMLLEELKSRERELPEFEKDRNYFRERQSPYFDALELLDFYLEIPGQEGEK